MEDVQVTTFWISYALNPSYRSNLFDTIIVDPTGAVDERSRILKHDRTTTVALAENGSFRWVIKRYNTKNLWHGLRRTVRRSRAFNCWQMSKRFQRAGMAIPNPVAYIEQRFGPLRGKSYFISEYVDADDLLSYLTAHPSETESLRAKIVQLFDTLCTSGINHGDLKNTNILVADHRVILLDLDAAGSPRNRESFERGYRKDRSRFLKNWTERRELYDFFAAALPEHPPLAHERH